MNTRQTFRHFVTLASLGLLFVGSPLPASAGGAKHGSSTAQTRVQQRPTQCRGKKHRKSSWRQQFEPAFTAKENVSAEFVTWDGQAPPNRRGQGGDPYVGRFTGYRDGTTITVKALRGLETFTAPTAEPIPGTGVKPPSRSAKRTWRKAYSAAQRWEHLGLGRNIDGTPVPGTTLQAEFRLVRETPSQTTVTTADIPARLASHMPLRVFGKHEASGLNYPTVKTNAIGSPERPQPGRQNGTFTPMRYAELASITNISNVHYRPLGARKADGSQELKVLGMAAYPPGAEVRISNPGTGEKAAPFIAGQKRGGDFAKLSVTAEHRVVRVDVLYHEKNDQTEMSRGVHLTRYIHIPRNNGEPSWSTARATGKPTTAGEAQRQRQTKTKTKRRVISYFSPSLVAVPERYTEPNRRNNQQVGSYGFVANAQLNLITATPALKRRGERAGASGKMTIRWKKGAFEEGTIVTFQNARFPLQAQTVLIHPEMKRELTLEAFADDPHINVTLTHPIAHNPPIAIDPTTTTMPTYGSAALRVKMPKIERAPAEMGTVDGQRVPFYAVSSR